MISVEMHLFAVSWSKGQIVEAVWGHIPNSIEEPEVSDRLHAQLPSQERRRMHYYTKCLYNTGFLATFGVAITVVNNW